VKSISFGGERGRFNKSDLNHFLELFIAACAKADIVHCKVVSKRRNLLKLITENIASIVIYNAYSRPITDE